MESSKKDFREKPKNLWKKVDKNKYQVKLSLIIIIIFDFDNSK